MNINDIKNVLIAAPHPDDEVLGCAGIINKLSKMGKNVFIAILTNGQKSDPKLFSKEGTKRGRKEALKAHKILGVKNTFFFDFPTVQLTVFPEYKISIELSKLIKEMEIDTIFIPHRGDLNSDHLIIYRTSLVASRPIENNSVKRIYTYETLSETEWASPFSDTSFIPNIFVDISKELDKKIEAFKCFSPPRLKLFPHPRSIDGINNLAKFRGQTVSLQAAESFALVREII